MIERVTTALDVLGLLLLAAGVCAALYPVFAWGGLIGAGGVVLAGSWWAATGAGRRPAKSEEGSGTG